MKRTTMAWCAVAAFYTALALAYSWPLLHQMGTAVPSDTGDPALIAWGLWWNAHAIPFTARWWSAPMFFPVPGAFALSETFLGLAVITTPLQWAGLGVIQTYNVTYILSFVAAALSAHALARHLTGRHDVAIVAGLAFGFSPYRASQMPHLHLLVSWWMPLGLLALHRFISGGRRRDLVVFGVCWALNGLTSGYYLMFFAVLVGLWMCWFARSPREWILISITIVVASLPLVPLVIGYHHYQSALGLGDRGRGEVETFSADLSALWAVSPHAWLPSHWTVAPRPEGELYPGITVLILTLLGAAAAWRRDGWAIRAKRWLIVLTAFFFTAALTVSLTGGWQGQVLGVALSVTRPLRLITITVWCLLALVFGDPRFRDGWRRRSVFLFYGLGAAAMMLLALGPTGRAFGVGFLDRAPYLWLMNLPGGASLRVPARFGMLVMLCLAEAAAIAFSRLKPRGPGLLLGAVVSMAVLLDGWVPHLQTAPTPSSIDLSRLDPHASVIEVPMVDLYSDTAAMFRATGHGHAIVNGFSGFYPPHYEPLRAAVQAVDPTVFDALRQLTPLIVVVNHAKDKDGRYADFVGGLTGARREADTAIGRAYSFAAEPESPRRVPDPALPIAAIEVSGNAKRLAAMTDDDLRTNWETEDPQAPGDEVRVTLDGPMLISQVEMDLGDRTSGFPRVLRISAAVADGPPARVWEGSTAARAFLGALRDPFRMPISIDLPPSTLARRLWLTVVGGDPVARWAITELRIAGRAPPTPPAK